MIAADSIARTDEGTPERVAAVAAVFPAISGHEVRKEREAQPSMRRAPAAPAPAPAAQPAPDPGQAREWKPTAAAARLLQKAGR